MQTAPRRNTTVYEAKQDKPDDTPPHWFKRLAKVVIYAVCSGILLGLGLTLLGLVVKLLVTTTKWMWQ